MFSRAKNSRKGKCCAFGDYKTKKEAAVVVSRG